MPYNDDNVKINKCYRYGFQLILGKHWAKTQNKDKQNKNTTTEIIYCTDILINEFVIVQLSNM